MTVAATFCSRWYANDRQRKPWLVIGGRTGCGKTRIAKGVYHFAQAHNVDAFLVGGWGNLAAPDSQMVHWPTVVGWNDKDFEDLLRDLKTNALIILDDIGAETDRFKNAVSVVRLCQVLEICDHKWLFATTNVDRTQWKQMWDVRVADRLRQSAWLPMFEVPSYRITPA